MEELESNCKVKDGFEIREPFAKAGWTFFNLVLSAEMASVIENSGMMEDAGGFRISEQLKNFLGHFLESKGSNVRITKIDYQPQFLVYYMLKLNSNSFCKFPCLPFSV